DPGRQGARGSTGIGAHSRGADVQGVRRQRRVKQAPTEGSEATMAAQHSVARVGAAPVTARPSVFKSSQRILGRDWPIAWLFFLPAALLLFGLIGYPFVRALYLSFFNVVGVREGAFVGFQNYI